MRSHYFLSVTMLKTILLTIVLFQFGECQTCPNGYTFVYDSCFLAVKNYQNNWEGSHGLCPNGGSMAIINSCNLHGNLVNYFLMNTPEVPLGYWIGASYSVENDKWLWKDGSNVSLGVPYWGTTGSEWAPEPSNETDENCVMLVRGDRYRFHNEDCSLDANVLCQADPVDDLTYFEDLDSKYNLKEINVIAFDISCPDGYELIGNSCFYFYLNASDVGPKTSWDEANLICQKTYEGSHLAILDTCDLFTEVVDFINNHIQYDLPETKAYWLGGKKSEDGRWYWINSNAMEMGVPFWGTLGDGTPEPSGGEKQNCVTMYRDDRYYFHDGECGKNAYPLCQLDPIESA